MMIVSFFFAHPFFLLPFFSFILHLLFFFFRWVIHIGAVNLLSLVLYCFGCPAARPTAKAGGMKDTPLLHPGSSWANYRRSKSFPVRMGKKELALYLTSITSGNMCTYQKFAESTSQHGQHHHVKRAEFFDSEQTYTKCSKVFGLEACFLTLRLVSLCLFSILRDVLILRNRFHPAATASGHWGLLVTFYRSAVMTGARAQDRHTNPVSAFIAIVTCN